MPQTPENPMGAADQLGTLKSWAAGEIRTSEAMQRTGSRTLFDLIDLCAQSDVSLETDLTERELASIDALNRAIGGEADV